MLLHAYVVDALMDGDTVTGARFATVGGMREYRGRVVIDTTADAYVAASAGVPTQQGDDRGRVQPASLMFRLSHVDLTKLAAYVRMHPDQMRTSLKTHERIAPSLTAVAGLSALWQQAREDGIVDVPRELVSFFISPYPDEVTVNMTRVVDIDPLDPDDLTRAEVEARLQTTQLLRFFRERVPGFENARIAATGTQIGIRESRRIVGRYTLTRDDVLHARRFDDAVARSAYPIDIHNPSGSGTTTQRLREGESYEIPYRCLVPVNREQLLVAGRCISTTHEALASTRLTPTVMTLGQAAGTAAALSRGARVRVGDVDVAALRAELVRDGVDLRRAEVASMNAAIAMARSYGIRVSFADLGDWGLDELRSEYDPKGPEIRLNIRVAEQLTPEELGEFVVLAIGHELYHHRERLGEIVVLPDRVAREMAANDFARGLLRQNV